MCRICAGIALGVVVAGAAAIGPAKAADCGAEVSAAFEKQRKSKGFRTSSLDGGAQGLVAVQVDYVPPDRMHQIVRHPNHPEPIETIAIGRWAWATMGGGWEELQPQFAQSVTAHTRQALVEPLPQAGVFECLGKVAFEGQEYLGYRSAEAPAVAPPDRGPGAAASPAAPAGPLVRTIYVDPASGLPMLNVVGDGKAGTTPVYKAVYSYPGDIKIESPIGEPK
jgi:hypothetical protein